MIRIFTLCISKNTLLKFYKIAYISTLNCVDALTYFFSFTIFIQGFYTLVYASPVKEYTRIHNAAVI